MYTHIYIISMYTLKSHNVTGQLYVNKAGKSKLKLLHEMLDVNLEKNQEGQNPIVSIY